MTLGFGLALRLAGFLDLYHFAALVIPTLGACAMRHLLFVAVGTLGKGVFRQGIMGPPGRGSFLRVAPFWIRHGRFLTGSPSERNQIALYPEFRASGRYSCDSATEANQFCNFSRISLSADQRGSSTGCTQAQSSTLRFFPQIGQSPLQSSRHSTFKGTASSVCSRKTSSSSR